MADKRHIRDLVHLILIQNTKARNSDRFLYCEVVKRLNPELAHKPFTEAMMNANIPNMETVRRSRALLQAKFEHLRPSSDVEAMRSLQEEEYRHFVKD